MYYIPADKCKKISMEAVVAYLRRYTGSCPGKLETPPVITGPRFELRMKPFRSFDY
jgi:hypothetical protein